MDRLLNQLGNLATLACGGACACIVALFIAGAIGLRWAGGSLIPLVGDLIVGRADRTPETPRGTTGLSRPAGSAVLKTHAQSLDFDDALRRQGGVPVQAQAAYGQPAFGAQAAPQAGFNAGPNAVPTLQSLLPGNANPMPATTIQPLYDSRLGPQQPFPAQAAPQAPYQAGPGYAPLGGVPSLSGQPPASPGFQPLGGYQQPLTPGLSQPGYQQPGALAQGVDPNAFFPPPSTALPRRASLSAPRDVSQDTLGQAGFNTENYPGLRSRRRRSQDQDLVDDQDQSDRGGIGGIINDLGNMIGM